jgi:hypothetical protein
LRDDVGLQEFDTRPFGPPRNTSLYDYDHDAGGYTAFFGNSNGMAANFKMLTDLAAGIWTDKCVTPFPRCIIVTLSPLFPHCIIVTGTLNP